jgi:hypothetical protein
MQKLYKFLVTENLDNNIDGEDTTIIKEADPTGLSSKDKGAKLDHGKPDLGLVLGDFSRALIEVGKVGTFGAKKYSEHGWLHVPNGIRRYTSAELRHQFYDEIDGPYDSDSGLLHKAHKAWNSLAVLELALRELEVEK